MARGKKAAKALTLEEKLEQALVPEEEQPYAIPENWCWTSVEKVSIVVTGGTPSKKNPEYYGDEFPFFKPSDLDAGRHVFKASEYLSKQGKNVARIIPQNSTAVCCIGSIGKCGYLEIEGTTNQQINSAIPKFNSLYLFYFMNSDIFIKQLWSKSSATTISIVNKTKMESCYFPLAPLLEQQRIVTRIENLFTKLDEAKEKAQSVIDGFELRKSAILHKAFTGELTEQWRKEHGVGLDSWETVTSKKLFEYVTSGSRGWAQYYSQSGAVFVRMGNLQHSTIELDMSSIQYVDLPDKAEGQRSLIKKNDILISITADVGMIGLVRDIDFEGYINQHVALARPAEPESAEFIAWYLVSDVGFKQFRKKQRGATKVGLGLNDIRTLCLDMPIMAEQKEILNILNRLMIKEHQAKQAAESVLAQIDTMKKAILARAFRGELGTNNPSDENAIELLKKVLAEKN
ncbi:MAG: restriction endonuclease [Lachnospiraceae bacterium]|nr:restriction endonuclease [Lachnospiraceae bacterium]